MKQELDQPLIVLAALIVVTFIGLLIVPGMREGGTNFISGLIGALSMYIKSPHKWGNP